jgi:hypothetical protein
MTEASKTRNLSGMEVLTFEIEIKTFGMSSIDSEEKLSYKNLRFFLLSVFCYSNAEE